MKRTLLILILALVALAALPGQEMDLQLAVTTQALNQQMLEQLSVDQDDIDEILALQLEFQLMKEQTSLEMNVIKAQIAQKLYYMDTRDQEIMDLLEKASELRLEQEQAQVRTFLQVREHLGEETWKQLMQRIRIQARQRQLAQEQTQPRTRVQEPSGNASGSGSSGSSGNAGSTGRR